MKTPGYGTTGELMNPFFIEKPMPTAEPSANPNTQPTEK